MSISVKCSCGQLLRAPDEYAGKRGECRSCGRILTVPSLTSPASAEVSSPLLDDLAAARVSEQAGGTEPRKAALPPQEVPLEVKEFLDPPMALPVQTAAQKKPFSWRPMFEALLDPRSIQWMLMIGGTLLVLGLIVWLVSRGYFKDVRVLAATLGGSTLAMLAAGWWMALRTRYKVAGQAITFLSCVVAPLNLWFLHANGLVTLERKLWLGGLVCSLLYIATVFVLADPLFMYAVEVGITLTVGLFLAELNLVSDASAVCLGLLALGIISIHAERAFPAEEGPFTRRRFGLPVFWSGQAQVAAGLLLLLITQVTGWLNRPLPHFLAGQGLTENYLLAGALWLAATYAYIYSYLGTRAFLVG